MHGPAGGADIGGAHVIVGEALAAAEGVQQLRLTRHELRDVLEQACHRWKFARRSSFSFDAISFR